MADNAAVQNLGQINVKNKETKHEDGQRNSGWKEQGPQKHALFEIPFNLFCTRLSSGSILDHALL